jgi:hypothetical protein
MGPRCNRTAPAPDEEVRCNREVNHDGPHRGTVSPDEIIFWSWGRPRRVLTRLQRDESDRELWIIVDPTH